MRRSSSSSSQYHDGCSQSAIEVLSPLVARGIAPFALALTLGLSGPVHAELTPTSTQPSFSAADLKTISRNESLRSVVGTSPWLVHRILRLLDEAPAAARDLTPPKGTPGASDLDPDADPDLQLLQRNSPEAAHELFLLIKQAGKGGSR